jgi:hypothetical protein
MISRVKLPARRIGIELKGGLGNQLFQLAALEYVAQRENVERIIDLSRISTGNIPRTFEVPKELCQIIFETTPKFILRKHVSLLLKKVVWRFESLFPKFKLLNRYYSLDVGFDNNLVFTWRNSFLVGYFQTFHYAQSLNWPQKFANHKIQKNEYKILRERMLILNPTVLHIRGNDYLQDKSGIGNLDSNYFLQSLKLLDSETDLVWIFSDDIDYAIELANLCKLNYVLVDRERILSSFETLMLMSCAKKIIISNSTFAWWAAFLSQDAQIYAPDQWFQKLPGPKDLIPTHWNLVKSFWKGN